MASAWSNEGPSEQVVNTSITLTIHPNIKRALPEWHVGVYSTPELTNTLSNIVQSTGSEYVRSIYKELTDEHFSETYATFLPALRWWDYYVKNRFFGEDLSCPRVIEAYHEHTEAFVSVLQTEEQKEYLKLHLRAALEGESEATQLFSDWSTVDIDWLAVRCS